MDRPPLRSSFSILFFLVSLILSSPPIADAQWSREGLLLTDTASPCHPHVLTYGEHHIAITLVRQIHDPVTLEPEPAMVMLLIDDEGQRLGGHPLFAPPYPQPPVHVKYAPFGESDLAVALLTQSGWNRYALHVGLVDPRVGWLWPGGPVAIDLALPPDPEDGSPLPDFDVARTESGRIVVTTVRDSTTHVDVLDRAGSLEFSYETEGISLGAGLAPRQGEELWLLELNSVHRVKAHRFPVETGIRGEPVTIARAVLDQDGEDNIGRFAPDGEGGLWYAQSFPGGWPGWRWYEIRANHLGRDGEARWGSYGTQIFTSARSFADPSVGMDIRAFGPDRAYVTFTGWSGGDGAAQHVVIELGGTPEDVGIASRFLPAVPGVLPRLRLHADGDLTVVWQSTSTALRDTRIDGGRLTQSRYLGHPLETNPSVSRVLVDLSHGGALRNLMLWRNRVGESTELRVLPEALIPGIRQPEEDTTWFQDQPATIRWRSAGTGQLDVDLSLDGGASWLVIASGIEDACDSLTFSVPELQAFEARVRVRRVGSDMVETSPSFDIRPRGPEFGVPAGQLRLSFTPDGSERVTSLATLQPRDVYLLARIDFSTIGQEEWNDALGLKAWESRVVVPEDLVVIERELLGPQPINVSPLQDHWAVGFGEAAPVGPRWVPLVRYRVMVVDPSVSDIRMDLRGPQPSSFDNYGGPGPIPGWLEWPASGECPQPCLRAFAGEIRASSVALNPRDRDVALVEMTEVGVGERQRDFRVPLQLKSALADGALRWTDLHLVLEMPSLVDEVVDLAVDGGATLDWDQGPGLLSFAVHRGVAGAVDGLQLELTLRAGSQVGAGMFRVLSAQAYDAEGQLIEPLVSLHEFEIVERVPVLVSSFRVERIEPIPLLRWESTATGAEFRLWAINAAGRRAVQIHLLGPGIYKAEDEHFMPGRTDQYRLEGRLDPTESWLELAHASAPVGARTELGLSVHPNPTREGTTLRWRGPESLPGRLQIFDLRGRLVREWVVRVTAGRTQDLRWDGTDGQGHEVAMGVYFAQLRTVDQTLRRKISVLR